LSKSTKIEIVTFAKSCFDFVTCRFFAAINGCYWIKRLQFSSVPDWVLCLY